MSHELHTQFLRHPSFMSRFSLKEKLTFHVGHSSEGNAHGPSLSLEYFDDTTRRPQVKSAS
jgi:hypothetical protein